MTVLYSEDGTPLNDALCDAWLAHGGYVHFAGGWYSIVTMAPASAAGMIRWVLVEAQAVGAA